MFPDTDAHMKRGEIYDFFIFDALSFASSLSPPPARRSVPLAEPEVEPEVRLLLRPGCQYQKVLPSNFSAKEGRPNVKKEERKKERRKESKRKERKKER
jgi:hypothetical protein